MGYESAQLTAYMRFTALLVDLAFLISAILILHELTQYRHRVFKLVSALAFLLKPDLILIDHGHFQYNSLMLGFILLSYCALLKEKTYLCCILFTLALNSKQMSFYYAFAFTSALLGLLFFKYRTRKPLIIV